MKVMHVLNTGKYSGAENVVISLIKCMSEKGIQSFYVSYDGPIRKILEENNIEFVPISKLGVREIKRVVKENKPDIVQAHDFVASITCAMSLSDAVLISHIHCNPPWLKKIGVKSILYGMSSVRYKKIISVSNAVFEKYILHGMIHNKNIVVGNPIDPTRIKALASLAECDDKYDVIYLGRLSTEKNPLLFLDIIRDIKEKKNNISAVMVGSGDLKSLVQSRIHELQLEDNIEVKGFMANPYGLLSQSKVLCVTSEREGFGLVASEALVFGKPVVSTAVGEIPNVVGNDDGKICASKEEFVQELFLLLNDADYYNQKSKAAFMRAGRLIDIEEYSESIAKTYKELV